MSGKKNNKYSNEFKQTIVNLYHSGKTYSQIWTIVNKVDRKNRKIN